MATSWWKLALALGTAGGFCSLIPSCAENNESVFIRQVQQLVAPLCTATNDPNAAHVPRGFLDVGLATSYSATLLVGNQMISRGDPKQSRAESHRFIMQGARVQLRDGAGNNLPQQSGEFSVIATGVIDPATSADAVYGVTSVELIPPSVGLKLRAALANSLRSGGLTVQAEVRIFGVTTGNQNVETAPFNFPIDVCFGCSVDVPAEAIAPSVGGRNCKNTSTSSSTSSSTTTCFLGQDALKTDCRLCQASVPVCRPCETNDDCADMQSSVAASGPAVCDPAAKFCK